jgi:hypothetical protein
MKVKIKRVVGCNENTPPFIILNGNAQVYTGLICGYPDFSNDWDEAKTLYNPSCLRLIQAGVRGKIEIQYL